MSSATRVWLIFAACVLLAALALGGVTRLALQMERASVLAQRRAAQQEAVRTALYRMDSRLAPMIAAEAGIPASAYPPPSTQGPFVERYFQIFPETFLPAPEGRIRYTSLRQALEAAETEAAALASTATPGQPDWTNRSMSNVVLQSNQMQQQAMVVPLTVRPGLMVPVWAENRLFLARRVEDASGERIQGGLLDWRALRSDLLAGVSDLLPSADLLPVNGTTKVHPSLRLASLPVVLNPGELPGRVGERWSPLRLALAAAWICGALAVTAVGALLGAALSLSARRGAFVSAVTHEMRTPLTTFRLYADLLAEGRVEDESKRRRYYDTLRAEAVRLGHLVENVLAYARLEKRRTPRDLESTRLRDALDRLLDPLSQQAQRAGMALDLDADDKALDTLVRIDPAALERILMNLVDNACKHGQPAAEPVVRLEISLNGRDVVFQVIDTGPGISPDVARRLFRPFGRSARDAAGAAPGVGLGLALSRRLARHMHGDLYLERDGSGGACFVLRLPGG